MNMKAPSRKTDIVIADGSGFCFGVERATSTLEEKLLSRLPGERIFTLGHLIHNEVYNARIEARGVTVVSEEEIESIALSAREDSPVTVILRAHGITDECEKNLGRLKSKNPFFGYIDCTCPFVKKIHRIAENNSKDGNFFLLLGQSDHPETKGIISRFNGDKLVFSTADELKTLLESSPFVNMHNRTPILAAQTTQNSSEWKKTQEFVRNLYTKSIFFDTICSATEFRQQQADLLSRECDFMVVIGGKESSNTEKLYRICKKNCPTTVWIVSADELNGKIPSAINKAGIVAGASTPRDLIEEVYEIMSETKENFAQMLEEEPLKTLNTGDVVTGTVVYVSDSELQLDLGAGVTGLIKAEQITDDSSVKLKDTYKPGDTIEAFVIRVSDIEGYAELSKKRADADRNRFKILEAKDTGDVLTGKVVEAVKGGVVVIVDSVRVFVPASQTGVPKDGDLASIVGTEAKLHIIDVKEGGRAVGSIRQVLREERRAAEEAFWAAIEEGKTYTGTVKSLTSFGAFVDLGGVDGMVHKTELSWKNIKSPAEVVSVGDELTVYVKSFDAEKKRISLGYKTEDTNPWFVFTSKYAEGDVANVKIVSLTSFGAFAEIVDGVDGLIHISQIANKRIAQPSDVLEIGQEVDVKITAIDNDNKKVSLSIRELLADEEPEVEVEVVEEVAEEAAPADAE